MKSLLFRARASTRVQIQLTKLRKQRNRWVDQPLRLIEMARKELKAGDVDVLVLGDSSTLCWSVHDTDRTLLPDMLAQRLGKVVTVAGPGFGSHIYKEVLRILATMDERPRAVVIAMAIRANSGTHIVQHPTGGYPRSRRALAKVTSARHRIRAFGRGGQVINDELNAAYRALPVHSRWAGRVTMAHYRSKLEGQGLPPWPIELERLRFDFFHGEYVTPDDPLMADATELGRRIDEYGVPTVAYWTRPPKQRGEMHFPGEFEDHVRANLAVLQKALLAESRTLEPLLEVELEDSDYEDSQNGNEHYTFEGRTKYADAIADRVRQMWAEQS